mmetsp:Transcript_44178/g.87660  ORF Transcript_44178/g.87660 Transcript_44178/m.87660 type:complete len:256 (+) Transcript_44178:813-1580(+)
MNCMPSTPAALKTGLHICCRGGKRCGRTEACSISHSMRLTIRDCIRSTSVRTCGSTLLFTWRWQTKEDSNRDSPFLPSMPISSEVRALSAFGKGGCSTSRISSRISMPTRSESSPEDIWSFTKHRRFVPQAERSFQTFSRVVHLPPTYSRTAIRMPPSAHRNKAQLPVPSFATASWGYMRSSSWKPVAPPASNFEDQRDIACSLSPMTSAVTAPVAPLMSHSTRRVGPFLTSDRAASSMPAVSPSAAKRRSFARR